MNTIKVDLGSQKEFVNLYPLGDIHLGSSHFDKKKFEQYIKMVKNDENGVLILNGDLINNAIKTSVSDIYTDTMSPENQLDMLYEYLLPIKDKVIGCTTGNHEERTYRLTGIDVSKNLCYRLGIEDLYSPIANIIFLSFGKSRGRDNIRNTFSIYHSHGVGGGRTVGAKANSVKRMSEIVHADIYIHSHTHVPMAFKSNYVMSNCSNKGIKEITRLFANTQSYEAFGGYGERMLLTPTNNDGVVITLWADAKGNKKTRGSV